MFLEAGLVLTLDFDKLGACSIFAGNQVKKRNTLVGVGNQVILNNAMHLKEGKKKMKQKKKW